MLTASSGGGVLRDSYRVSERHARQVVRMHGGTFRYRSHRDPRTEQRMRIREIRVLLKREGWKVGKYRVGRISREG